MGYDDIRFSHFIAELALNPARIEQYLKNRESAMEDADLSDEERNLLRTDNFRLICEYLEATGERPGATWLQGGPPGSGGGTGEPGG